MKFVLYTNSLSEHQLPLAREIVRRIGDENFRYVYTGESSQKFQESHAREAWIRCLKDDPWLEQADVMLVGGIRPIELLARRAKKGLKTYYMSERWFKPLALFDLRLFDCLIPVALPGRVRMWVPRYRRMAKRFVKWANGGPGARVLAIGPWAKTDFLRLGVSREKIVDWGYFVEKGSGIRDRGSGFGESNNLKSNNQTILKILWCGRMLGLKRVETIIRAGGKLKVEKLKGFKVKRFQSFKVTLVGDGPEKERLIKLAQRLFPGDVAIEQSNNPNNPNNRTIAFLPSQPMEKVRELMREHDLFVFPSNGLEGWGAVVSEALEEGMRVLASYECGAGAALLPRERLFHSGDWKTLAQLIEKDVRGELPSCSIGEWTAKAAATRLLKVAGL